MDADVREERVDSEATVAEVLEFMEERELHAVPVVRGQRAIGVISYEGLLRGFIDPSGKAKNYVQKVRRTLLLPSRGGLSAVFANRGERLVIITDLYGRFRGFVTREDALKRIRPAFSIEQILEREFIALSGQDSLIRARFVMAEEGRSEVPVTENERLLGVITAKNAVKTLMEHFKGPLELIKADYTRLRDLDLPMYYVTASDGSKALDYFSSGVAEVPVVEGGKVIAVASVSKLFQSLLRLTTGDTVVSLFPYNLPDEITEEIKALVSEKLQSFKHLKSNRISLRLNLISEKIYSLTAIVSSKSGRKGVKVTGEDPKSLVQEALRKIEEFLRSSPSENKKDE